MSSEAQPLLAVENLTMHFPIMRGVFRREVGTVKAVDGLDFEIHERETLGPRRRERLRQVDGGPGHPAPP